MSMFILKGIPIVNISGVSSGYGINSKNGPASGTLTYYSLCKTLSLQISVERFPCALSVEV